jgi:hypothetical protein
VYACKKWLGWLGCKEVIDLSVNKVHIRITTSPRFVIVGPNTTDTYTMSNIYMTARYYMHYDRSALQKTFTFDDFKSIIQSNSANQITQETALKVISDNLDYAIAWNLFTDYRTVATSLYDKNVKYLAKDGTTQDNWNFKVNGMPIFAYNVPMVEAQSLIQDLFPDSFVAPTTFNSILSNTSGPAYSKAVCSCPIKIQLEEPDEIEVVFQTQLTSSTGVRPVCLFVKYDKNITIN